MLTASLSLAILLTSASTVFAANPEQSAIQPEVVPAQQEEQRGPDRLYLELTGNGQYEPTSQYARTSIVATATEDKEIYHLYGDQYVTEVAENLYQGVDKIELSLDDTDANQAMLAEYNVSEEIIASIEEKLETARANGNDELEVSIFTPTQIGNNTRSVEPTQYAYYSIYGNEYCDVIVKYKSNNINGSKKVKEGRNTFSEANKFTSLVIDLGSYVSKAAIFVIGGGIYSAVEFFDYLYSFGPITGGQNDYVEVDLRWDSIEKWTHIWYANSWQLGCRSSKAWLNYIDVRQVYASIDFDRQVHRPINKEYFSENYHSAAEKSLYSMPYGYYDLAIQVQIMDKWFQLAGA